MLIIKDEIQKLMCGYPTVSDKYNVAGAVLAGTAAVKFGQPVTYSTTDGYFKAIDASTGVTSAADIAGFVLATNVKLATTWPDSGVEVKPGEAFNLFVSGFMAIELDSGATLADVTPNTVPHVILATGKITDAGKASAGTIVPLNGVLFTGVTDTVDGKKLAEIYVK